MNQKINEKIERTENKTAQAADGNRPETKIRAGALSATVWKNTRKTKEGKDFEYYSVSIDRNYTDQEGNWKSTNSLRVNDLPKAVLVLKKAYEHLLLKEKDMGAA